jgi:hypothetical protein
MLLKTSKQLTVCILYQSIHETLSSCNSYRWLRGGAVVVTSGSASIEPLEQGCRMGARRSPGGLCCLEEGNDMDLQGRRGIEPCPAATERHPPPPSPLDRVQEEEGEGEVACAPLRWRLAEALGCTHPHTRRPTSAAGGEDLSLSICRRRRTETLQTLTI